MMVSHDSENTVAQKCNGAEHYRCTRQTPYSVSTHLKLKHIQNAMVLKSKKKKKKLLHVYRYYHYGIKIYRVLVRFTFNKTRNY